MFDYKISEIINHCKKMHRDCDHEEACNSCSNEDLDIWMFCDAVCGSDSCPKDWGIDTEERSDIDLPYKHRVWGIEGEELCEVIYFDDNGEVTSSTFKTEFEANRFIKKEKDKVSIEWIQNELQEVTEEFNQLAKKHRDGETLTPREIDDLLDSWDVKVVLEKQLKSLLEG